MTDETPLQDKTTGQPNRPGPEALYGVKDLTEETAQRLANAFERSYPIRRLPGSQVATAIVGTIGLALFIVGVENSASDIPILEHGWAQVILGLILLATAGVLIRRLMQ